MLIRSNVFFDVCMEYKYEQLYNFYESNFDVRIS